VTGKDSAAVPPRSPLRHLFTHSLVYGTADVVSNLVNFLLVPLYTAYLSTTDYGNLALLLLFGTLAKILCRLGLDAGFFRIHYDLESEDERRLLAGTVALFGGGVGVLFLGGVGLSAPILTRLLFGASGPPSRWVALVAAEVVLGSLAFVPLNLLRIEDRSKLFSALSLLRHGANTVLKILLLRRGLGVEGVLWSDLLATGLFALSLLPVLVPRARWGFSVSLLREALGFGLPKVPHGLLIQVQNLADRKILDLFVSRAEVGLYQMGYTFGMGVKFALSAFEPAWGPFVYSHAGRPDGPRVLARVATYAFAVFAGTALAVAVLGPDLLVLMTPRNPAFRAAAPLIPVVALAYLFHGAFLLGSIGIGIERKARYYPLITAVAAATNVAGNLLLIPRCGVMGAAWATVLSYAVTAGLGFVFSHRLYPLPFQWRRIFLVAGWALVIWAATLLLPAALWPGLALRALALLAFPVALLVTGFVPKDEWDALLAWARRTAPR
jgi:O-antigen/teichoic acid export membrane protein